VDPQDQFVQQAVTEQGLGDRAVPVHEQVEFGVLLELRDRIGKVPVQVTDRTLEFAELFYGPIALAGADMISHYSAAELRLLAGFFRAVRELQARHLARVQDLPRPGDLIS
jgi:hypothetical protein